MSQNSTKLCPREPTPAMFIAGTKALAEANEGFARKVWYAMVDAAPEDAPAPAEPPDTLAAAVAQNRRVLGMPPQLPTMEDAIAAGDGTLHGAIDYWQEKAAKLQTELSALRAEPQSDIAGLIAELRATSSRAFGAWPWELCLRAAATLASVSAERDAFRKECKLLEHKIITCGVAATHPNAALTTTGAYKEKWNSPQAERVRALRAKLEAAQADAARYRYIRTNPESDLLLCQDQPSGYNGGRYIVIEFAWLPEVPHTVEWTAYTPERFDAAIDAAIAKGGA